IFTSANSVTAFRSRLTATNKTVTNNVLAVGPATAAALTAAGIKVTLLPGQFRAEGALAALIEHCGAARISGLRFLFPRSAQGRELLVTELTKLGAQVDLVTAYQTIAPAGAREEIQYILEKDRPQLVAFASPSAIHNFAEMVAPVPLAAALQGIVVATIG